MPLDYVRFIIKVRSPLIKLGFSNEFEQHLFVANIEEIIVNVSIGATFTKLEVLLLQITMLDQWTGANTFPFILETRELTEEG